MKLKIKITVPDDSEYRRAVYPYDIREDALVDIRAAVRDALHEMQRLECWDVSARVSVVKPGFTVKVSLSRPE